MKKLKFKVLVASLILATITAPSFADSTKTSDKKSRSFYEKKSEGWHWYEREPEPEPEQKPKIKVPVEGAPKDNENSSSETKNVVINVQWLRENLPKLRDKAIDDPSYENVSRYYYVQRIMTDKATKFASVSTLVNKFEIPLNEELRRPENQTALNIYKGGISTSRTALAQKVNEVAGLFFIYASSCAYCDKQAPLLNRLNKVDGIDVLAVSLDGKPLKSGLFPNFVIDNGKLSTKLKVMGTPTIYLVKKDGTEFHNIAYGLTSPDEIKKRMLDVAVRQNWVTEEEYNLTQDVRPVLLADDSKGQITVDENKLYSDPDYLAERMRQKFREKYKKSSTPAYH